MQNEINIQQSVSFRYTDNEVSEKEIKKSIPFTMASERIKYLGVNTTKEVKDLYVKTIKYWFKTLKKTQVNGKIFHVHRLEELKPLAPGLN